MAATSPQAFPTEFETDVVLRDGSTVHVRPVREDDEPALTEFFRGISINSMALRFFSAGRGNTGGGGLPHTHHLPLLRRRLRRLGARRGGGT